MSKRYERMSKEEVVEVLRKAGGSCDGCAVPKKFCSRARGVLGCAGIVYKWLDEEIKKKRIHRYELIKSPEDLDKLVVELGHMCSDKNECSECKYMKMSNSDFELCLAEYLKEEIEVELE